MAKTNLLIYPLTPEQPTSVGFGGRQATRTTHTCTKHTHPLAVVLSLSKVTGVVRLGI